MSEPKDSLSAEVAAPESAEATDTQRGTVKLRDVATLAGVNVGTASRALSGRRRVAQGTVERVSAAAAALGYAPNLTARSLRLARTMTLGAVVGVGDTIHLDIMDGVTETCQAHDYSLMVNMARGDPEQYKLGLRRLIERQVDGIFLCAPLVESQVVVEAKRSARIITLLTWPTALEAGPFVYSSEEGPILDSMTELKALGHRCVVYLTSRFGAPRHRPELMRQAATKLGMTLHNLQTTTSETTTDIAALLNGFLHMPEPATAAYFDYHTRGLLLGAVLELGLSAPADISLVGFGRSFGFDYLSTIDTAVQALGRQAAELMIDWVENDHPPPDATNLPISTWAPRQSIGPPPQR